MTPLELLHGYVFVALRPVEVLEAELVTLIVGMLEIRAPTQRMTEDLYGF